MRKTDGLFLCAILLHGCAHTSSDASQQLNCEGLHRVIDSAKDSFIPLAGQQATTRFGNTWGTRINAFGNRCTLLSGTETPSIYFCGIADRNQEAGVKTLKAAVTACLGPDWKTKELPARPATRFTRAADNVAVDVGASDVDASRASVVGLTVRTIDSQSQSTNAESVAQDQTPARQALP